MGNIDSKLQERRAAASARKKSRVEGAGAAGAAAATAPPVAPDSSSNGASVQADNGLARVQAITVSGQCVPLKGSGCDGGETLLLRRRNARAVRRAIRASGVARCSRGRPSAPF